MDLGSLDLIHRFRYGKITNLDGVDNYALGIVQYVYKVILVQTNPAHEDTQYLNNYREQKSMEMSILQPQAKP